MRLRVGEHTTRFKCPSCMLKVDRGFIGARNLGQQRCARFNRSGWQLGYYRARLSRAKWTLVVSNYCKNDFLIVPLVLHH